MLDQSRSHSRKAGPWRVVRAEQVSSQRWQRVHSPAGHWSTVQGSVVAEDGGEGEAERRVVRVRSSWEEVRGRAQAVCSRAGLEI